MRGVFIRLREPPWLAVPAEPLRLASSLLVVPISQKSGLEILATVKNAQNNNLSGIDDKGDHNPLAIVGGAQARAYIVPLVSPLRKGL
ncbi:hypothetical protein PproGo58_26040 [Pseudomonas protegens]|nr:hypothetical protein PproGo58_26040 [Pseudomonas protegens]